MGYDNGPPSAKAALLGLAVFLGAVAFAYACVMAIPASGIVVP